MTIILKKTLKTDGKSILLQNISLKKNVYYNIIIILWTKRQLNIKYNFYKWFYDP